MEKPSSGNSVASPDLDSTLDLISQVIDVRHLQHIMRDAIRPFIVAEGVTTFVKGLVMTPLGARPPVGALGVYWASMQEPDRV
jgi:hypothetical protein